MIANIKKDSVHGFQSIGELQHLVDLASNNKEEFDYTLDYLKAKMANQAAAIKSKRESLITFLKQYDLDPGMFPIIADVYSDDIYPDTTAEQNIGTVEVEQAMGAKKFPNKFFDILYQKLAVTIQNGINNRIDELRKMKLYASQLEYQYAKITNLKKDYADIQEAHGDAYRAVRKDLEDFYSLWDNLGHFKYILTIAPGSFTSNDRAKSHDSAVAYYSTYYIGQKKTIKTQSDKLQENFDDVSRYDGVGSTVHPENIVPDLLAISKYFSDQGDAVSSDSVPQHYVDALQVKSAVVAKVDIFLKTITTYTTGIKKALDALCSTTGLGNKELESIYSNVIEMARSPVNARILDPSTTNELAAKNKTGLDKLEQEVNNFQFNLQRGIEKLDANFLKFQKNALITMASMIGFPVTYIKDRGQSLEDTVREKVRSQYGKIPFCDEVLYSDGTFVKKSEIDPKTGKKKTDADAKSLLEKALLQEPPK